MVPAGVLSRYEESFSEEEVERIIRIPTAFFMEKEPVTYGADSVR